MKAIILSFILWTPISLLAQANPLDLFKPLEGYTWSAEGKWGDGSAFKQDISIEFALNDHIVKVESMGYTNKEQTEYGHRNYGVRQYDEKSNKVRFWEFDVFGGVTEGTVEGTGKNIIYKYEYGGTLVTEMWIYRNETTYDYIVGIYDENEWKQKFLETQFKGMK